MGGAITGLFYLGIVGSKLYPYQSASDLAKGPLKGEVAIVESKLMPSELERFLVGHACTRVGILMGVAIGVILIIGLEWHWYFVLPIIYVAIYYSALMLKVFFKTA